MDELTAAEIAEALVRSDLPVDEQTRAMREWCKHGGRGHVGHCMRTYMLARRLLRDERLSA